MTTTITRNDVFALVHPALDIHTLGISSVEQILRDCGYQIITAGAEVCEAFGDPDAPDSAFAIEQWLRENRITILGFSYRLDPSDGTAIFAKLVRLLKQKGMLSPNGNQIRGLYFAGLPKACEMVRRQNPDVTGVFCGDETPAETLEILGINPSSLPAEIVAGIAYDEDRLAFGRQLIAKGEYLAIKPVNPRNYPAFGTRDDTLVARLRHGIKNRMGPLMRAHMGPYLPDRLKAVRLFQEWARQLASAGHLDILSIGTSQLTQSNFGEDWGNKANGGGVPFNSREDFAAAWQFSRPMLVRTYAGTRNIPVLARMYEETIHIAWHALSLWWFCQIDGRGPYSVRENLQQHIETLKYIASTGKPFEANVSHHFAFRGADDVTYIVSAYLAARLARQMGIHYFVLQNMLNTPKYTWGIQDLAKSRAMLQLVRTLQADDFHVILQPRGGLDYFSHELGKSKAQLAAVAALMDDIEPGNANSPHVVHVVSYSEASHLADPAVINESIQITRHAIEQYRKLRAKGDIDDMSRHHEVLSRTNELLSEARTVIRAIGTTLGDVYTADGLYQVFAKGFLSVPYLWECRDEFSRARQWQSRLVRGSVKIVNDQGQPISAADRMSYLMSESIKSAIINHE